MLTYLRRAGIGLLAGLLSSAMLATTLDNGVVGIMLGTVLGGCYALLDRRWVGFFIDSDPIRREYEGPGTRTLRSLGAGAERAWWAGCCLLW